ncbi:MAG: hypothetical protein FJ279_33265 [Planctomycetes bacterium]|nr:hypothetical protein [Planctomycetota bacterium]
MNLDAFEERLRAYDLTRPNPSLRERVMSAARAEIAQIRDLRRLRWLTTAAVLLVGASILSQRILERSIRQAMGIPSARPDAAGDPRRPDCGLALGWRHYLEDVAGLLGQPDDSPPSGQGPRSSRSVEPDLRQRTLA